MPASRYDGGLTAVGRIGMSVLPPSVDVILIAATALVVAVRGTWIVVRVIVSSHHPSVRLTAIRGHQSGFVVAGAARLAALTASAILLPQLLATIGYAPHFAEAVRVTIGGLIAISLLAAVSIAFLCAGCEAAPCAVSPPSFPGFRCFADLIP
jgi:hypothetical protein